LSQQNKGHKVPRAHTAWPINKKAYAGSLPQCNQCKSHHSGPCTVKCGNCKKVGHIIQNCRTPATAKNQRTRTCYECGSLRHYKSECPIAKSHKRVDMIHERALEQVRRLHAMNVGIKGTTGEIVQSKRTKTMKTKSKVLKHVEWCMPLEEEKLSKTLTTLRMRLKLKRESCLA
nr:reverse transcriptase domain-containing protein [Tanacetum cinerariifolium]